MDRTQYDIEEANYALTHAIGRPRTVLDVGCGTGMNGAEAKRLGAQVIGIEINKTAAKIARSRLDEVFEIDITQEGSVRVLNDKRFDLIVFGDVLEHMIDPLLVLRQFIPFLEDGGHMLISLPNIAAWPIRLQLLKGEFNYEKSGILDETHLRFFTRKTACDLAKSAGLEVLRLEQNPMLIRAAKKRIRKHLLATATQRQSPITLQGLPAYQVYSRFLRPIESTIASLAPGALSFQTILVTRKPPLRRPLSLVIGMLTYNEETIVATMIDDIRRVASDAEIVLVDSSSDHTADIARAKGATVLRQVPPQGHGPAMELLMTEASKKADALIYLDCDSTYPIEDINRIRGFLEGGADVVNATRTRKRPKAMPVTNFIANRLFAFTACIVNSTPTTDVHSGMRGYRSSVIRAFRFDGSGDALPVETLILPARSGYHIVEYPIPYAERTGVSKLQKIRGTIWSFIRIARSRGHGSKPKHYDILERH